MTQPITPLAPQKSRLPDIIVSLDAEWVNRGLAEAGVVSQENRVLTYQTTVLNRSTGAESYAIYALSDLTKRGRKAIGGILALVLSKALKEKKIDDYPTTIGLIAHFTRADLCHLKDWKIFCRKVDSVRGTFATVTKPMKMEIATKRGTTTINIYLGDTSLLTPGGNRSLDTLGNALGVPKVELPAGYTKDRMDRFMAGAPDIFRGYAITDTIIAARWADHLWRVLEAHFGITTHVPTLAAVSLRRIKEKVEKAGLNVSNFFGYHRDRCGKHILPDLSGAWTDGANAYHGGRNECLYLGYSPAGTMLYDADLASAYFTTLAMIRVPDWQSVRWTRDIDELAVIEDALTFAYVTFEFPHGTRFPCLAVRAGDRGLVFPRTGFSWCTGAELRVAIEMGATINVRHGWRIDWVKDSARPAETFAQEICMIRTKAEEDNEKILRDLEAGAIGAADAEARMQNNNILSAVAKEIGNSTYGKLAQAANTFRNVSDAGIYGKKGPRAFDVRTEQMKDIPPSAITNPIMAAFITGMTRAVIAEALHKMPLDTVVISVTTDGVNTSMPINEIDTSGPAARAFAAARRRIDPANPEIWKEKHRVKQVLSVKTRGVYTVSAPDDEQSRDPVIARAGSRFETYFKNPWEECQAWERFYRERTFATKLLRTTRIDMRTQWENDLDLIDVVSNIAVGLDYDMKRKLVMPVDVSGLITATTEPWESVEAFHAARDGFEQWKKAQRAVLKTVQDHRDMEAWLARRQGQAASGSTAQSGRPPLVNAIIRAIARGALQTARWPYRRWAALITVCGWKVNVMTLKNAARRGRLDLGRLTTLTLDEKRFAEILVAARPCLDIEALMTPGSSAAGAIATIREIDYRLGTQACDADEDEDMDMAADEWDEENDRTVVARLAAVAGGHG